MIRNSTYNPAVVELFLNTPLAEVIRVPHTDIDDWTAMEDSSQENFQAHNSPFCIRGAVMGFP